MKRVQAVFNSFLETWKKQASLESSLSTYFFAHDT